MIVRDVRYSLRALRKTPAFTVGAIATVALTVGATTAIFSAVYGVLLRQLPYRNVEQVFWIWSDQPGRDRTPFSVPDFIDYRDSARTLAGFAGFFAYSANLSDEAAAERIQGIRATGNLFDVMGARARIGRLLQATDERPGAEHVVVLTEPFWVRRFGGDRGIIGRAIRLNSEEYTVVGVLAAGFALPVRDVEFVLPFGADQDPRRRARNSVNFIIGVGRLGPHVSLPQAASELTAIARRLQEQFPVENARKRGVRMVAVIDGIVGPFRTALLTIFAAVAAVLFIACANLANLMLTRALSRRKDFAVQLALGSSRLNVVRQVLVEALLVGVSGGILGVLVARWGVAALVALAPTQLPRSGEIRVDAAVLLFSLSLSSLTGVLFGVIPAITSAGVDVRDALHSSSRGMTAGRIRFGGRGRASAGQGVDIRGLLVSSEVALAVVLLIVMTMLAKSFANVQAAGDPMNLATSLAREVRRIDPEVVASQIRPMGHYLSDAVAPRRFSLSLMAAFALAALALAITGIYAVVTYSISQRAREIGIRVALGASRPDIVRLVMGDGIRFILIGLAVGIAMAVGVTRLLASMLFGVAATDAMTFGQVAVVVAAASLIACGVPTARAGRQANIVLKTE